MGQGGETSEFISFILYAPSGSERSIEVEELCKNNRQNVPRQKMLTVSTNQLTVGDLVSIGDIKTL